MTTSHGGTPAAQAGEDEDERHRLTALEGLAALSLDALSSVAYGPEAILVVRSGSCSARAPRSRHGTDNVVICRMRFRPTTWSAN